ncbi:carboxymuconolactone decarboxylase family protein [Spirillospora sp. NPDC052269]
MAARSTNPTTAKPTDHFGLAGRTILGESTLPSAIQNLVILRAGQLNGDTHAWSRTAAQTGETRINLLTTWRDSKAFTEPERAALDLTEQATRIAKGGAATETWTDAAKHYTKNELSDLLMLIALINTTTGMNAITRRRRTEQPSTRQEGSAQGRS